jgi:hypothetical protein
MARIRTHFTSAHGIAMLALFVALGGTSYALAKNSISAREIKKNAVAASEIKKNAVRAAEINRNAVGASEIRSNAVAGGDVADGGIGSLDIGDNAVGSGELSDNSVGSGELSGNSVGADETAANSVGSEEVTDGSLLDSDLAPGVAGGADAFARVQANGTLQPNVAGFPPQNKGTILVSKGEGGAATGTYCFDTSERPASALATLDNADAAANVDQIVSVAIDRGEDLGDCPANRNDARVRIVDTDLTAGGAEQDPGPADARFFIWFEF